MSDQIRFSVDCLMLELRNYLQIICMYMGVCVVILIE